MEPTTLLQAIEYFKDPANCREYMIPRRWTNGVVTCPTCGSDRVKFSEKHNRWQCAVHHLKRQFTLKTGTIMEDSPIGLNKWLPAIWLMSSNRNGISSWELHRGLGITQKSAWFMLGRIRLAMQDEEYGGKIGGEGVTVQVDETFIGGKARNMHKDKREKAKSDDTGSFGKMIVLGALENAGKVRTKVVSDRKKTTIKPFVEDPVRSIETPDLPISRVRKAKRILEPNPQLLENNETLNRLQAAKALGVHTRTLDRWIKDGKLTPIGGAGHKRFRTKELRKFLNQKPQDN